MEYERNLIWDGFITLERGIDSGRVPASLNRNQASFAVNTTFRGGYPASRPGWIKRNLSFKRCDKEDELDPCEMVDDLDMLAAFQDGQFQGSAYYDGILTDSSLVVSISGNLYRVRPNVTFTVTDITPATANSSRLTKTWFCQAEEFMVIQDGQSKPIVFDGSGSRRLERDDELPVGTCMAYGQGRIWVASPSGFSFMAGDLVYGSSGTAAYGYRDAVLKATENQFLNEGGEFGMPANSGGIRAMTFTNNLDTSLGQGPLLIHTPQLIASVQAPIDRTVWKDLQYPIQTVALTGYGALSDNATITANGDVFYRSTDGIRSFALARRDMGMWGNTPVSAEMNRVLQYDSDWMLPYSSAVVFDNRLFMTVSPYYVRGHGVPHRGLAVMDFDILSRMSGKEQPAWEGIWTGLTILQLVKGMFDGQERCFAWVSNGAKQIELWEFTTNLPHDNADGVDSRITWSLEPKSFDFDDPFGLKYLEFGELFIDQLQGELSCKAWFRSDAYAKWVDWHNAGWTEEAEDEMTLGSTPSPPLVPRLQGRSKMRLPRPTYTVDDTEGKQLRAFFTIQPRFEFTGKGRLRQARLAARPDQEHARGAYRT